MTGWLVNDMLTGIPGTKTLWHNLLEWMPNLEDKTGGYTDFSVLAGRVESQAKDSPPDYIIRNASYFRKLNIDSFTISLMQDPLRRQFREYHHDQIDVCNNSDIVVFNSNYMRHSFKGELSHNRTEVIPLGVDFNTFAPFSSDIKEQTRKELGILENSIVFVGADNVFKGFDTVKWLIENTDYNYCLVMKDNTKIDHDRCRVFHRVNQEDMVKIYNACSLCICTSVEETQHLSSIEAGACGLPIVTTNVGIHYGSSGDIIFPGPLGRRVWGEVVRDHSPESMKPAIDKAVDRLPHYDPRVCFLYSGLDTNACRRKWLGLLDNLPGV
jgi:glycosyltransferase involved in cell wall biosynthesis